MIKGMIRFFEKQSKLSLFITFVIAGVIFYLSSLTFSAGTSTTNILSIAYHLISFFFLSAFLLFSLVCGKNKKLISVAILIAIAYALSDEIHQFFVPGRSCTFSDILLDSVGIMAASVFYTFISLWKK